MLLFLKSPVLPGTAGTQKQPHPANLQELGTRRGEEERSSLKWGGKEAHDGEGAQRTFMTAIASFKRAALLGIALASAHGVTDQLLGSRHVSRLRRTHGIPACLLVVLRSSSDQVIRPVGPGSDQKQVR